MEADSSEELKKKMGEVVFSYMDSVIDTDDRASIPDLIRRKAPMQDFVIYYLILISISFHKFRRNITFKEFIPVHLVHSC